MEEEDLSARIQLCFPATYSSTNPKQITTTYEPECKTPGKDIEDKQPDLLHSPLNISSQPIYSGTIRKLT